jgi:hypothetical protein
LRNCVTRRVRMKATLALGPMPETTSANHAHVEAATGLTPEMLRSHRARDDQSPAGSTSGEKLR